MKNADLTVRLVGPDEQKSWDSLANHPLQAWSWGEFRKSMGIDVTRLAVYSKNKLIEGWQLTFHKIPYTPWTIGYFPKGPAIGQVMVDELAKLGREKSSVSIQIEPNILYNQSATEQFKNLRPSHRPLFTKYTFVLDLTKSPEDLLKTMHPKTRYNLKIAQKHGVTVKEDNSDVAFDAYLELTRETTSRQGFYAHDAQYHRRMWKIMHDAGIAKLFTASLGKEILSAWIIFVWKETVYYPYGTSSRNHREVMAPNLLLWEICLWAKNNGLKYFDLWGALEPNPDTNDPWYGFHRFKQGYNPTLVEFTGSFDLVIKPLPYRLYTFADDLRWKILELK